MNESLVSKLVTTNEVQCRALLLEAAVELTALQAEVAYLKSLTSKLEAKLEHKNSPKTNAAWGHHDIQ